MTPAEILILVLIVVLLGALVGLAFQLRAILREVRAEGRDTRSSLAAGVERVDALEMALLEALKEALAGHTRQAEKVLAEAEALPRPHRPIWRFNSEEATNGERVSFYRCTVGGCRDVLRVGPNDPEPEEVT